MGWRTRKSLILQPPGSGKCHWLPSHRIGACVLGAWGVVAGCQGPRQKPHSSPSACLRCLLFMAHRLAQGKPGSRVMWQERSMEGAGSRAFPGISSWKGAIVALSWDLLSESSESERLVWNTGLEDKSPPGLATLPWRTSIQARFPVFSDSPSDDLSQPSLRPGKPSA